VVLDGNRVTGELEHIVVADAEAFSIDFRGDDIARSGAAATPVDHPLLLTTEPPGQHRAIALAKRRLVDVELVGIDRTLDDVFPESVRASDEHNLAKARFCVEREYDAAGCPVGTHHLHHADRERHLEVIEAIVDPVRNRAVGEDGSETAPAHLDDRSRVTNIEEAFVLAGEARGRQILGRRGTADRDRDIGAVFVFELSIGRRDRVGQRRGAGRRIDDLARLASCFTLRLSRPSSRPCGFSTA
jgi:hypothetical protein